MTTNFKFGSLLLAALLSGCGTAPGMYLSVAEQNNSSSRGTWSTPSDTESAPDLKIIYLSADNMGKYSPSALTSPSSFFTQEQPKPYRLGLQDVLRINVWGHPDFMPTLSAVASTGVASVPLGRTINDDGKLFFPLVGSVPAAGLTVAEFRQQLTKALATYIKDPQIDVDVAAFRSQRVFLAGEVKTPGAIPVTDLPLKITDALAAAGGTTAEADLGAAQLTRGQQSITLDLNRLYYSGELNQNLLLRDGDVLTVPDRQSRKVFLLGEVMQPKSYLLRRGRVSLAEVLADAGGTNPLSANSGEVFVMRLDDAGKPLVFQLDAKEPSALLLADRFDVQSRDLVYVNPTKATRAVRVLNQYLPFLQGASSAKSVGGF